MAATTAKVDFVVNGKTYQTWYMVVGDMKVSGARRPLVVVHGGPGMSHHYLLPHKALWERVKIPVIFYDQLGNGQSTHIRDAPKEFWTPELFMDELDNLLAHLGITDDFDLLGQSWGGMLAGQYAASRRPPGMKRLIISNSPADMDKYEEGANNLLEQLPAETVKTLRKHEEEGTTSSPDYQEGIMMFYKKHICTTDPWPEELNATFAVMEANPTVYTTMLGPSEFTIIGTLRNWSISGILHQINRPTLLISSPADEVQPASVWPWFKNVPKLKWVEFQKSSHLPIYEEPERYFEILIGFLDEVTV